MLTDSLDTNLLQSTKRAKDGAAQDKDKIGLARVASRKRRLLKALAYIVLFFFSLVFFTLLKIPDSLVTNLLLNSLNQNTPYQWQAERVGLGFFPTPHLRMEKLALDPKFPGAGLPLAIDEIRIYPNPFSLLPLGGGPALGASFKTEAYKSFLKGSFSSGTNQALRLQSESIDLARIQPLTQMGLDIKGMISSLFLQISLPNQRLNAADGEINIKAKNIVFDPGALGLPMALPILNLGDVELIGQINHGQLKLEKFKVGSAGKDLELQIPNGTVTLSDVMPNTRYELHLLVKPSTAIEKAVPGISAMLASVGTLKSDGFYAMKIQGTLAAPAFPVKE